MENAARMLTGDKNAASVDKGKAVPLFDRLTVSVTGPSRGIVTAGERQFACALGKGGLCPAEDKREGDGRTPVGVFPLRHLMYRPDRWPVAPETALPVQALTPQDGWCDDPADRAYNRPVPLPYAASHELLWRDEAVYDLIIDLGYNDDPPQPGRGSAIFLHIAREGYSPTEGCVALSREDLAWLLRHCGPETVMEIRG